MTHTGLVERLARREMLITQEYILLSPLGFTSEGVGISLWGLGFSMPVSLPVVSAD